MGVSGIVYESYKCGCKSFVEEIVKSSFINEGVLFYRNSECGYKNKVDLFLSYNFVEEYVESLKKFINDEVINSYKEFYSFVRLKLVDVKDFLDLFFKDGIKYLEYRSIDINFFEKGGISLEDLYFF